MPAERERLHNLPAHRVPLVGREAEAQAVRDHVLAAARGLLTLTGAGGSGKTSLALHVAEGLLDEFPDGVWLVELAPLGDRALVAAVVATSLGVREQPGRPIQETLLAALEPRSLLLVLDNCEHLIEACAELVEALLAACPSLRIVATSREPLRITAELVWRVPSLTTPDPHQPPTSVEDLAQYSAVRLFVDRVRAVQPSFALTPDNTAAVAQLCARLDGIPLALELAAARMRVLGVGQLIARLDDSFRVLAIGSRTAPTRQQTLRATLDWSYRLLSEPEQWLFRRLSVFAGGFDFAAVEAVGAAHEDVLDLLTLLVDKSLVLVDEHAAAARYRLLEPVRQYARHHLAHVPEERDLVERQHAEHFLTLTEEGETRLRGPEQAHWFDWLEREHDNLRAALAWSQADRLRAEHGLRLAAALGWFWYARGYWSEGRAWVQRVLASGLDAAPARARLLAWAGLLARWQGDYTRAEVLLGEALNLSRAVGDRRTLALTQVMLGSLALIQGDTAGAMVLNEGAVVLSREVAEQWLIALSLELLGEVLRAAGDIDRAASCYEESLAICRRISDTGGIAVALADLAHVALQRGDGASAAAGFAESLALARANRDQRRVVMAVEGLAGAAVLSGHARRAAQLFGVAHAWREAQGVLLEPADRPAYARDLAATRDALASSVFQAAWAEGVALSLDQAASLALAVEEAAPSAGPTSGAPVAAIDPLTRREREVVVLIARGLTNRQIAQQLVISERTADNHVANILSKLAFSTRSQVAVWAAEHKFLADAPDKKAGTYTAAPEN